MPGDKNAYQAFGDVSRRAIGDVLEVAVAAAQEAGGCVRIDQSISSASIDVQARTQRTRDLRTWVNDLLQPAVKLVHKHGIAVWQAGEHTPLSAALRALRALRRVFVEVRHIRLATGR